MVGQTINGKRARPLGSALALVVVVVFLVLAVTMATVHWAIAAVLPAMLALLWWPARRPFRAEFTDTALEMVDPPRSILYENIEGLQANRPANPYKAGRRFYPIQVVHTEGYLVIPARLNVPSDEVYSFLFHRLSSSGSREVDPALADYLRAKQRRHGAERVYSYARRLHAGGWVLNRFWMRTCSACVLTGVVWCVAGVAMDQLAWFGVGFPFAILTGFIALALWLQARGKGGKKKRSSLIICPDGLALRQGEMVGELRWDEIRKIVPSSRGLVLKLAGAEIRLVDVYDRPLAVIHQLLTYYYEGGGDEHDVWRFDASLLRDTGDSDKDEGRYARDHRDRIR